MKTHQTLKVFVFLLLSASLVFPSGSAQASMAAAYPTLPDFISLVTNGQKGIVRGVYVPGVMAYPVILQSSENPGYVSAAEGIVTQFVMAAQYGTIGLLAHNYLAGSSFYQLAPGQEVVIVYGDGSASYYTISSVGRYQALDPNGVSGSFIDLDSGVTYTATEMFSMYYDRGDQVTFQTCIERDGLSSWGRLFITALPGAPVRVTVPITGSSPHTHRK